MEPIEPRGDILPVILGGDWSTYAIAREFLEAFGCPSVCIAQDAVAVIKHARFISMQHAATLDAAGTRAALQDVAAANPQKTILLMANTDDRVELAEQIRADLPSNLVCPLPPHELAREVSDKVAFEKICARFGLAAPHTEVVDLAGSAAIAPSALSFPLVAKPAVSAAYAHLYNEGFKKVYFVHEQTELDELWASLRARGFAGAFLVQELIEGDDTYIDLVTMYVDGAGQVSLAAGAQVLLEDHAPSLLGNPVAMLTKPLPALWDEIARMLQGIGWRGFANFDLKRDARTGRQIFMDFNPRMGASSYHMCAGGINPMLALVHDAVDGREGEVYRTTRSALYTRVPPWMLDRYIQDPALKAEVKDAIKAGRVFNPTRFPADTLASRAAGWAMETNYVRKFSRFYPRPTQSSF